MNIASPWTITWDYTGTPLVLVTAGEELAALVKWPCRQKLETREVIEGDFTDFLPRGLKFCQIEFTLIKDHATSADAWAWVGTTLAAVPWDEIKALDFAMAGGVRLRMANCAIESAEPEVTASTRAQGRIKYVIKGRPPVAV
jgi:hypothetical protein